MTFQLDQSELEPLVIFCVLVLFSLGFNIFGGGRP